MIELAFEMEIDCAEKLWYFGEIFAGAVGNRQCIALIGCDRKREVLYLKKFVNISRLTLHSRHA